MLDCVAVESGNEDSRDDVIEAVIALVAVLEADEALLVSLRVDPIIDLSLVCFELGGTVFVYERPEMPMIVFAIASSGMEKVPFPDSQSHIPFALSGLQHHFPPPQESNSPSFSLTGLSRLIS